MKRKGFRDDVAPKDLMQSMTPEDWARIKMQKEFEMLSPGTKEYDIALYCDALRLNIRKLKMDIKKRLWNIQNTKNSIIRQQLQLETGKITDLLKDGVTMTEEELRTDIKFKEWMAESEALEIPQVLGQLRKFVGHFDIAKNVVMGKEEYDGYVTKVLEDLARLGYRPLA